MTSEVDEDCDGGSSRDYRPEYASQAETLCQLGFDEDELASFYFVDRRTIEGWKRSRPEFSEAVEIGKRALEAAVHVTALNRLLGYYRHVQVLRKGKKIYLKKYMQPNLIAAINWLATRQPEEWGES